MKRNIVFVLAAVSLLFAACSRPSDEDYPTVFAHRTCWLADVQSPWAVSECYVPENSLDGIRMAARFGYAAAECDVRWTLDSVLVCMHDKSINRTMRRSDGGPIEGEVNVKETTYEDLLQYRLWSCEPEFRRPIPRFEEMLLQYRESGVVPLLHCSIFEGYEMAKEILGDGFICFTTDFGVCLRTRAISSCKVLLDPRSELTKRGLDATPENVISLLREIGGDCGISSMKYEMCSPEMCAALRSEGYDVQSSIFPTPHEMAAARDGATILLSDFCWKPGKDRKPLFSETLRGSVSRTWGEMELGAMTLRIEGSGSCTVTMNERTYEVGAPAQEGVRESLSLRFWHSAPSVSVRCGEDSSFKVLVQIFEI